MLKVKFLGESESTKVTFMNIYEHVVELDGNKKGLNKTLGFKIYSMNDREIGDYSKFTTIYRELDNGYQYSDDGSHYIPPEPPVPPVPPEPTIDDYRREKEQELTNAYSVAISEFNFEGKTYTVDSELKQLTEMSKQTGIAVNYQGTPATPDFLGSLYVAQVKNGYDQQWLYDKRIKQVEEATTIDEIKKISYEITSKERQQRDIDNAEKVNFYQQYVDELSYATKIKEREIYATVNELLCEIIPEIIDATMEA